MKMMLNSRYQEKIGILCRIQNHFCQHVWMINELFTNNTCLVSRFNSIVFLSIRILLQPNQPMSVSDARSLADLDRLNTLYVETQSIFDRLIPTAMIEANKRVKKKAIYLKNGLLTTSSLPIQNLPFRMQNVLTSRPVSMQTY